MEVTAVLLIAVPALPSGKGNAVKKVQISEQDGSLVFFFPPLGTLWISAWTHTHTQFDVASCSIKQSVHILGHQQLFTNEVNHFVWCFGNLDVDALYICSIEVSEQFSILFCPHVQLYVLLSVWMEGIAQCLEYATAPLSGREITVNKVKYIPTFFFYTGMSNKTV